MPKMKSKRGVCKRFKVSSKGKVVRHKANTSHILTCKTRKRKRRLRQSTTLEGTRSRKIKRLMQA